MSAETKFTRKRGSWTSAEDQKLLELVEDESSNVRWVNIAEILGSRTSKQCRERYHQNLKPSLNHSPITAEEGKQIEYLVSIYGKRWAGISRHLKGRSDNAIKNWWNASANRRRSQTWRHGQGPISGPAVPAAVDMPERRHSLQPFPTQQVFNDPRPTPAVMNPALGPLAPLGPAPMSTTAAAPPTAAAAAAAVSQPSPASSHPSPPHIAPQVGVVFKSAYAEDAPGVPPSASSQMGAGAAHASAPSICPRTSVVGTAPLPPAPVSAPSLSQHFPSHAQHLQSYSTGQPASRLPAIESYLEERWRTLRKQSYDSAVDLSRYSLSVSSYPSSPDSRRSSAVTTMALPDSRRSSYAVGFEPPRLHDERRGSYAPPIESRRGSYAPIDSRRGSLAPIEQRRGSYAPLQPQPLTLDIPRRGSHAPFQMPPRSPSPSPLPPLDKLPMA